MDISTLTIAIGYTNKIAKKLEREGFKVQLEQDRNILETTGEEKVFYFLPKNPQKTKDGYDEFIYVNNDWEQVGVTDIDLSNYALKSNVYSKTEFDGTPLEFQSQYISIGNNVGSTVDIENISTSNPEYRHSVTIVNPGERFIINAKGGNAAKVWAFLDSDKKILSRESSVSEQINVMITAPNNAMYLIVNDKNNPSKECYKIGKRVPVVDENSDDNTFPTTKAVYDAIQTEIGSIESQLSQV